VISFKKINYLWALFWIATILFALFYFSDHKISPDEGFVLNEAWQLWSGKKMYVDFMEYITPASGYIIFWLWKIFTGPSYSAAKVFSIIFWIISSFFLAATARKLSPSKYAIGGAVVLWLFAVRLSPIINHNSFSSYCAVILLYIIMLSLDRKKGNFRLFYFLTGFLSAVTFLFLQTKGLLLFSASIFILFILGKDAIKEKIIGSTISIIIFFGTLFAALHSWSFKTLFYSLFIFPRQAGYMEHTYVVPLIVVLEIAFTMVIIYAGIRYKNKKIAALGIFQGALYLSSINIVEISHFTINSFPLWIFFTLGVAKLQRKYNITQLTLFFYVQFFVLPISLMILIGDYFMTESLLENNIYVNDFQGKKYQYIFKIKEIDKARYIYSGPFYPGLYFEYRKPNPFYFFNGFICDEECQAKMLDTFKRVKPEFAFLDYEDAKVLNYDKKNLIDIYINNNYIYCGEISRPPFYVYARSYCPPCPEGIICNGNDKNGNGNKKNQ
jgi:hypothetical protein